MLGDAEEFGLYNPSNLSTKEKVIVVAMNYRVTTFGFMALEELMAEHNTTGVCACVFVFVFVFVCVRVRMCVYV